ncbi:MAG: DUF4783 domain-containing protein [Flavisolibacter sp.]
MKNKIFSLLLIAAGVVATAASLAGLDDVIRSLHSGNTSALGRYMDDHIEITLPEKSESYSKAQGLMVLKDFLQVNGVRSFEVKQKGESGGQLFCIGLLHTRSGTYRTTIFMTTKQNRQLLREIRFYPT